MPPNHAEVTFGVHVSYRDDPQDTLLDFEGHRIAGHHGNPEPGHHRLLDALTALEHQRVVLHEMGRVEHVFHDLAGSGSCLTENRRLPIGALDIPDVIRLIRSS